MTSASNRRVGVRWRDLPSPEHYFSLVGVTLTGSGEWRNARCPFHDDRRPSMRVHLVSGAFVCFGCGAKGGNVLAFHRRYLDSDAETAARDLGAWGEDPIHRGGAA